MFSNNPFKHSYNTMCNQDILNLQIESLSDSGFCFLWVLNSILDLGYKCLKKWGYEVVDQLVWVKAKNDKVLSAPGYYFHHSSEICLVGLKRKPGVPFHFKTRMGSNIMTAEIRKSS